MRGTLFLRMRVPLVILLVAIVLAVSALAYYRYGPRWTPPGQPALVGLSTRTFHQLAGRFNDGKGRRVILMLSHAFLDMARTHPERLDEQERAQLAETDVVWDFIACFGPEAKWQEDLPMPEYSKAPVVNAIDDFVRWLNGDTADERRGEDDESDRANPAKPVSTSAARVVPLQERLR